jgi:hypothetical protein
MTELPCKTCIAFALCNAKGPFNSWPEMDTLYQKCNILYTYLHHDSPKKTKWLDNKRLYEMLFFFNPKLKG